MAVQSPIHSFVDFEDRLNSVVLPAYQAQFGFQFLFSSDMDVPRTGTVDVYAGNAARSATLFALTASVTDVCYWGKITGIDADADFPIVIAPGEIIPAGTYATIDELYAALTIVGFNADSDSFLQCCTGNLQDYTITATVQDDTYKTIAINFYRGLVYVERDTDEEAAFETAGVKINQCYSIAVKHSASGTTYYSNLFKRVSNTNYLTFLSYYGNEDSYDFHYPADYLVNKLWFPLKVKNPLYPTQRKIYRKSNKQYKVLSSTTEKQWDVETDAFPDAIHDRLVIAMEHDNKHFTSSRIDEDVFMNSDYSIDWAEREIPGTLLEAKASFKVLQVFAGRNSNCEQRPVCVDLPEPMACVPVEIPSVTLPNAFEGAVYDETIELTGTAPFVLSSIVKPAWMTITVSANIIHFTGTPPATADDVSVSFVVTNCTDQTDSFSQTIDVVENGTHWLAKNDEDVDNPLLEDFENIQIMGAVSETVTVTVTGYTNAFGGTITFNGTTVTGIGQTFPIVLDGTGLSAVIEVHLTGASPGPGHSYGMLAQFTITAATGGSIGSPSVYQISKSFS